MRGGTLENQAGTSIFSNLMHIGIIAKDAGKAVQRLESLGMGTFELMTSKPSFQDKKSENEPVGYLAKTGQMEIEVFQPSPGDAFFHEFISTKGEGIHHLGFLVDDLEASIKALAEKGFSPLTRGKAEGTEWVDYDIGVGGIVFQLIKRF
jgi:methylmalonyl-CoA/ethylmalonyl-CoA epimerase